MALDFLGGSSVITGVFRRARQESQCQRRRRGDGSGGWTDVIVGFQDRGRSHEPRTAGGL